MLPAKCGSDGLVLASHQDIQLRTTTADSSAVPVASRKAHPAATAMIQAVVAVISRMEIIKIMKITRIQSKHNINSVNEVLHKMGCIWCDGCCI